MTPEELKAERDRAEMANDPQAYLRAGGTLSNYAIPKPLVPPITSSSAKELAGATSDDGIGILNKTKITEARISGVPVTPVPKVEEKPKAEEKPTTGITWINDQGQTYKYDSQAMSDANAKALRSGGFQIAEGTNAKTSPKTAEELKIEENRATASELTRKAMGLSASLPNDPTLQRELQNITAEWGERIKKIEESAKSKTEGARVAGYRHKGLQFSGGRGGAVSGIVSAIEEEGMDRVTEANRKKDAALIAAESAYKKNKFSEYVDLISLADKEYDRMKKEINKTSAESLKHTKELEEEALLLSALDSGAKTPKEAFKMLAGRVPIKTIKDAFNLWAEDEIKAAKAFDNFALGTVAELKNIPEDQQDLFIQFMAKQGGFDETQLKGAVEKNITDQARQELSALKGVAGEYESMKKAGVIPEGMTFDEADQLYKLTDRYKKMTGEGTFSGTPEEDAESIMLGVRNLQDFPTKDNYRDKVGDKLTEKFREARKSGDIYGIMRASAVYDKEPGDTFINSMEKVGTVLGQIGTLNETINNGVNTGSLKYQYDKADGTVAKGAVNTGPIIGALRSKNPWDTQAQVIKAQLNAIVPNLARGVYGEVGVLTDNDIKQYSKTLPSLSSTEAIRNAILYITVDMIRKSIKLKIENQASGQRDMSGYADMYKNLDAQAEAILKTIPGTEKNDEKVLVTDKNGKRGYIPKTQLDSALKKGYTKI